MACERRRVHGLAMDADFTTLQSVALAALLAWVSGIRLYLVVFLLGLAGAQGYIDLPPGLKVIQHSWVIGAAGVMLALEFFADKIPGVDSIWDFLHTFVRIPAGALLAAGATGDTINAWTVAAGILRGSITARTHLRKAATRAAIHTSPGPFSHWAASFTEDA